MEEIRLEKYIKVIHTLVWKFRNLGYADNLYAPIMETGMEAAVSNRFGNMDDGPKVDKKYRFTVKSFEDLISEGYLVFTELKNSFEKGEIEDVTFEQALITKLQSHFTYIYQSLMTQKRKAKIRHLNDNDEQELFAPRDSSVWERFKRNLPNLSEDRRMVAEAILTGEIKPTKNGNITKASIAKYLRAKGWKREIIRPFLAEFPV